MEEDSLNDSYDFQGLLEFQGLKKKKKVRFIFEDPGPTNPRSELTPTEPDETNPPSSEIFDPDTFLNFDLSKKKKKRKKSDLIADSSVETPVHPDDPVLESTPGDASTEYTYEDLLSRVFAIMRERDPNRDVEANKKLVIKPPQVIRIGSKKTSFINFLDLCKQMHRLPSHVQSFLLVELGTSGSIDGNNQLIIKGRFEQKMIENVLRRYIREYVACHTCKSPDTLLQKDTRLVFLQCESCGARCSVASIKAGFQAVTGKRAAMRAKSN